MEISHQRLVHPRVAEGRPLQVIHAGTVDDPLLAIGEREGFSFAVGVGQARSGIVDSRFIDGGGQDFGAEGGESFGRGGLRELGRRRGFHHDAELAAIVLETRTAAVVGERIGQIDRNEDVVVVQEQAACGLAVVDVGKVAVGDAALDVLVRVVADVAGLAGRFGDVVNREQRVLVLQRVLVDRDAAGAAVVGGGRGDRDHRIAAGCVIPSDAPALTLVAVLDDIGVEGIDPETAVCIEAHIGLHLAPHRIFRRHPRLLEVGDFTAGAVALGDAAAGVGLAAVGGRGHDFGGHAGKLR